MSKNESVKASLDFYKGLIYLIVTGIFAVCGFFANNYKTAEIVDLVHNWCFADFRYVFNLFVKKTLQKNKRT